MSTDIQIASNALVLLGVAPISSFTDPGASARVAANLFESTMISALTVHQWRFAIKKQRLNRLSQTPENEWQYAFQLPSDYLDVIGLYPPSQYQIYQNFLYSNQTDVTLDYKFRPTTPSMPGYFTKMMEYRLAVDFSIAVTQDENKKQVFWGQYKDELARAMCTDAQGHPNIAIRHSPFTDVRYGGGGGW
jgi:hypothetical protein